MIMRTPDAPCTAPSVVWLRPAERSGTPLHDKGSAPVLDSGGHGVIERVGRFRFSPLFESLCPFGDRCIRQTQDLCRWRDVKCASGIGDDLSYYNRVEVKVPLE